MSDESIQLNIKLRTIYIPTSRGKGAAILALCDMVLPEYKWIYFETLIDVESTYIFF